jgi:dTDP-4-amino-4,6-dideoxygalactose transaminase
VRTRQRSALAKFLAERGIATGIHYPVPGHRQPAVASYRPSPLPHTEHIVDEILTLPLSAGHTEDEIGEVCAAIHAFFEERVAGGKPS